MDFKKKSGLYLHIPICRRKCLYCDFFSAGKNAIDTDSIVRGLITEMRERKDEIPNGPSTVYIGGGTPSMLPPADIATLLEAVDKTYGGISPEEITIEINPDDVTTSTAQAWRRAGVSRVSVGIQSLIDTELKAVGRSHNADKAEKAIEILRPLFDNISIDVIFGLPLQTIKSWKKTVEGVIGMNPDHISAYSLMLESGTAMTALVKSGRMEIPGEEDNAEMFEILSERLRECGYRRYEISNYSLPGKESRHNSLYWDGAPYLGLGPSAHSFDGGRIRRYNPSSIKKWLERGNTPFYEEEILSDEELREEFILTRMRTAKGIEKSEYLRRFGEEKLKRLEKQAQTGIISRRLEDTGTSLRLTERGIMTADDVILSLSM